MDLSADLYKRFVAVAGDRMTPAIDINVVTDVVPLDDQMGVAVPLTVPVMLQDMVFGPMADGPDKGGVPNTFVILDAANVVNLPEILEASELNHACLFDGAAKDDIGHVAPWLVQLTQDDPFCRGLFSSGDAPLDLWDRGPGIFVRSHGTLDDVRKHFRKFTKVRNGVGKWYYFRFWEPDFTDGLLRYGDHRTVARLLSIGMILTADPAKATFTSFQSAAEPTDAAQDAFILRDQDVAALSDVKLWQFATRLADWLVETHGPFEAGLDMRSFAYGTIRHAQNYVGLRDEKSIADYVATTCLLGYPSEKHASVGGARLSPQSVADLYQHTLRLQSATVTV